MKKLILALFAIALIAVSCGDWKRDSSGDEGKSNPTENIGDSETKQSDAHGNWRIIIIVGALLFVIIKYRGHIKKIAYSFIIVPSGDSQYLDDEIKKLKEIINRQNTDIEELKLKNKDFDDENKILRSELEEKRLGFKELYQRLKNSNASTQSHYNDIKDTTTVSPNAMRLYANSINEEGVFNKITEQPNEDTVFELIKKPSSQTAAIRIYEGATLRILKNPDFVDGCDKQKINPQPSRLQVEKGTAQKQDNGKWRVTEKAKIKFV
ncbi:hypothetical protein EZS27_008249 [termite gut metagenome]|uniref:Lipoprotein n=1 Tax=termite gut metagenome TaxID=433724 RepID=A0A5J4SD69_9ZZZZ